VRIVGVGLGTVVGLVALALVDEHPVATTSTRSVPTRAVVVMRGTRV
jgi:hypothetical protein